MAEAKKIDDVISLCDDCGTTQNDGTPCGVMFSGDKVSTCSSYKKDTGKHSKLVDKYGPPQETVAENTKDDKKGVK